MEVKNDLYDVLKQLKILQDEKELSKKHILALNESMDEMKRKILTIENKLETLVSTKDTNKNESGVQQNVSSLKSDSPSKAAIRSELINIDNSKTSEIVNESTEQAEQTKRFDEMNLKDGIVLGINKLGFVNLTPLEERIIVPCMDGRDVVVFSEFDSGRTMMMFIIPLLQRIDTSLNKCQALVFTHTDQLAKDIAQTIRSVGDFLGVNVYNCSNLSSISLIDLPFDVSFVIPHVAVGKPNCLFRMFESYMLPSEHIQIVINKAEELITDEFFDDFWPLMQKLETKKTQYTLLTSDKLDRVIHKFNCYWKYPVLVMDNGGGKENVSIKNTGVSERRLNCSKCSNIQDKWKVNTLRCVIEELKILSAIVYCNTLSRATNLCELLKHFGYEVTLFSLLSSEDERRTVIELFSLRAFQMIVTTDPVRSCRFAVRPLNGLFIINYDVPVNTVSYMSRISTNERKSLVNFINKNEQRSMSTVRKTLDRVSDLHSVDLDVDVLEY